jgi:DNA-binding HxlR family transcriptional regulator
MNVEEVLGSRGRLKIIKALAESKEALSLYYLEKKTGIRRKNLRPDILSLEKNGIVTSVGYEVKKYRLNLELKETISLINCLYEIGYISVPAKI